MTRTRSFKLSIILLLIGAGVFLFLNRSPGLDVTVLANIPVGEEPLGIAVAPDGSRIYVANAQSGTLSVIDARTHQVVDTLVIDENSRLFGVALSPDGTQAYISWTVRTPESPGFVSVVDLPAGRVVATIPVRLSPQDMALSADGSRLYVVNAASNNVSVIDTTILEVLKNIQVGFNPFSIVLTQDGRLAYVSHSRGRNIGVIDLATVQMVRTIPLPFLTRLLEIDVTDDGRHLYIADGIRNSVVVVDDEQGEAMRSLQVTREGGNVEYSPMGLAISPDGTRLYVVNRNGYLSVFELPQDRLLGTLKLGVDLRQVAFAPDGTAYITSQGTNSVIVVEETEQ
ncbi:MAG: beta-propeller fold lactonase family protein [Candidatus Bipolaricaulia bacterium]